MRDAILDRRAEQQALADAHFQAASGYWQAIYGATDVMGAIYQDRRAAVLALVDGLRLPPGSSTLEIGCGSGSTTVALAERGHVVRAVDTVRAMIDLTRAHASDAGVAERVTATLGDIHRLEFAPETFALVLAIGVTPWLHDLAGPLAEIGRVLAPGGHVVVTADNRRRLPHLLDPRWFPFLAPLRARMRRAAQTVLEGQAAQRPRVRMYAPGRFDAALAAAGLEKVSGRTLGFGPFSFLGCPLLPAAAGVRMHRRLQRLADRGLPLLRSTGAQYVVVARKARNAP